MPNINKVIFGNTTLIDLSTTTLSSTDQLESGVTAYDRAGNVITGTYSLDLEELTATPSESVQVFKPYGDEINYVLPTRDIIYNTNPMVGDIDLSFVTYGRQYKVTGVIYTVFQYRASSRYDILEFDTLWTASEDGEIEFSITTALDSKHPTKVTLSKTQIKVYYPEEASPNGYIGLSNTTTRYLVFSEKSCDAFSQVTVDAIPSQYIIPSGTKTITINGTGIDVASYASVDVNVSGGSTVTLQSKSVSYTPSASQQTATVTADSGYDGLSTVNVTVAAMPTGTAGTPTATKGTVSNHSISVTPSVTNTAGYISGGTKTGTAVSVSASELVSGTLTISASGTHDVTNYASASVASGGATASATKGTVSNHSVTVTPSVTRTAGYVTAGTASGTGVTVSASELVSGSETKTANGTYDVTNLASVVVAIPIQHYYTGSSVPSSSLGADGDIYLKT